MQRARTALDKDKRREALINSALDEFFDKGFKAARMDDIAARAAVSKGTLYLYFESKQGLFNALIESIAMPSVELIERISTEHQSPHSAIKQFCQLAPQLLSHSRLPQMMKILIADAGVFPNLIKQYRQQVIERVLAAITKMLQKGVDSGEIRVNNPALTARLIVAPVVFSAIWQVVFEQSDETKVDLQALFSAHQTMLVAALLIPDGGRPCPE